MGAKRPFESTPIHHSSISPRNPGLLMLLADTNALQMQFAVGQGESYNHALCGFEFIC